MKSIQKYIATCFARSKRVNLILACALISFFVTDIHAQTTYTFTAAGATGNAGPTQSQVNTAYASTNLNGSVTVSSGIQSFTIPVSGPYRITAIGAQGGYSGGYGASIRGEFSFTAGTVLKILVGQAGILGNNGTYNSGGGGGGSYVTSPANVPYVVAGGGGGNGDGYGGQPLTCCLSGMQGTTSTSGNPCPNGSNGGSSGNGGVCGTSGGMAGGGAGIYGNGSACQASSSSLSYTNGGTGGSGTSTGIGGFGGGGGGYNSGVGNRGGGGGGYSGGGGGDTPNFTEVNAAGGGGGSYNSGTNQTNTVATSGGDGKVLVELLCNLTLLASTPNPTNPVICSGTTVTLTTNAISNYSWSTGNTTSSVITVTPNTTTTYSVSGTSTANCTAYNVITVTVSSGSPVLSISNPSSNICLGKTVSLTATGAITYTWANAGVVNGQTFTPTSSAVYTVTGQNGCGTTVATTTITITPLAVSASVSPTIVCQGYPATLTAVAAVNGFTWLPNVFANSSTVSVNPYANTIYTVTASDGTCAGTATVALATKITPTITATASNTQICEGDNTVINATGANSYEWSPGNLSGSTHTVSPATSTLYVVTGTNNVGCYSTANVVVLVYPLPTVTAVTNKSLVCQGGTAVLSAGGASTYVWTNGPLSTSYTVNPQNTDTYTVTGADQYGCVNTQTVSVWVYLPVMNVSATPTSVCTGSTVSLSASTPSGSGYTWNGTPGQNVQLTPSATTVYVVTATSASNNVSCLATNSIQVVVNPNPNVTATANKTVMCKGDAAAVITGSGAATYTWNTAATTATIAASNLGSNTYTVNATDANGCKGKASISIQVNQCVGISDATANATQVLIYPNPTSGEFVVTGDRTMKLNIMNETGQLVKTAELNADNHYSATVSSLPAGLYLIVSESNVVGKVIITK